jgi:D-arabinose 1-dehydrogenase-like Zn-dependent alcohol dehydrogenase
MNKENSAYAEYIKSAWDVTFRVPDNISAQQAASAPIPLLTACQAFYLRMRLPFPDADNSAVRGKWILIWSGSTAVGQYAIQLAKLAGLKIATTASPAKHELVKSLGADFVVDYKVGQTRRLCKCPPIIADFAISHCRTRKSHRSCVTRPTTASSMVLTPSLRMDPSNSCNNPSVPPGVISSAYYSISAIFPERT